MARLEMGTTCSRVAARDILLALYLVEIGVHSSAVSTRTCVIRLHAVMFVKVQPTGYSGITVRSMVEVYPSFKRLFDNIIPGLQLSRHALGIVEDRSG